MKTHTPRLCGCSSAASQTHHCKQNNAVLSHPPRQRAHSVVLPEVVRSQFSHTVRGFPQRNASGNSVDMREYENKPTTTLSPNAALYYIIVRCSLTSSGAAGTAALLGRRTPLWPTVHSARSCRSHRVAPTAHVAGVGRLHGLPIACVFGCSRSVAVAVWRSLTRTHARTRTPHTHTIGLVTSMTRSSSTAAASSACRYVE